MEKVGIRRLKRDASDILRRVRDRGETFEITYRGAVVAQITPVISDEDRRRQLDEVWTRMDELSKGISESWSSGVSAVEAVSEVRRDL